MRVLLLSRYSRLGASSRVRSLQYLPYLERQGINVDVEPLLGDDYVRGLYADHIPVRGVLTSYLARIALLIMRCNYDLLWMEKELFPWLPSWIEELLRPRRIPYAVDYDDARFHVYDNHSSRLVRAALGAKIDSVMRRAALVLVGNDYLANRAIWAGAARVERLPTVVDLSRYSVPESKRQAHFTVGWIGTPRTAKYLGAVLPALSDTARRRGVRVLAVGAESSSVKGFPIETTPWSEDTEVSRIQDFDVGIMPLPDDPFERGKCGYKLIQYMACGKPVIASPVGVNASIVEHGRTGFLARDIEQWTTALDALCDNPGLAAQMGIAGRKKVEAMYSLQANAPRLAALLRGAAGTY